MSSQRPEKAESFRKAIARLNVESIAAFNRGDVAACAGFYAEDAVLLLPDHPPIKGRKGIEDCLKDYADAGVKMKPVEPVEILSSGDLGCSAGVWRFLMPSDAGGATARAGKFVTVFRRQNDGSWMAAIDSFFADTRFEP